MFYSDYSIALLSIVTGNNPFDNVTTWLSLGLSQAGDLCPLGAALGLGDGPECDADKAVQAQVEPQPSH